MSVTERAWIFGAVVAAAALAVAALGSTWQGNPPKPVSRAIEPQSTGAPPAAPAAQWVALPAVGASLPAVTASGAPSVVLSGVALGMGDGNAAIVSVDQRPDRLVRVGDALTASATILRIDDASMTYRFAGAEHRVVVKPWRNLAAVAKPGVSPAPAPLPGFVASAPPMARAAGAEPGSGNEAFRQVVEKKMQAIAAGR